MLTINRFHDGSYVIHGMTSPLSNARRISAWFTGHGSLIDCEAHYHGLPSRSVSVHNAPNLWNEIQRRGRHYAAA